MKTVYEGDHYKVEASVGERSVWFRVIPTTKSAPYIMRFQERWKVKGYQPRWQMWPFWRRSIRVAATEAIERAKVADTDYEQALSTVEEIHADILMVEEIVASL